MTKIVVMLIWMGGAYGGPTTIQGFHSMASCNAAIASAQEQIRPARLMPGVRIQCLELVP